MTIYTNLNFWIKVAYELRLLSKPDFLIYPDTGNNIIISEEHYTSIQRNYIIMIY